MNIQMARFSLCSLVACSLLLPLSATAEEPQVGTPIQAGQCWIYGQIQPRRVEDSISVTIKDSQTRIEITPAEIRRGYKQVVTQEGTVTYRLQPPTYKQVQEQVLVRPEVTRLVTEPAQYEQRQKTVVVEEARTVLEQCRTSGSRYTGAVAFCAREVPAKEKVINTQVLVKPEQTRTEVEPAQYKTVTRWVVDTPARITEVTLAPQVTEVPVAEVIRPAQSREQQEAALTRSLKRTRYLGEPRIVMRRAVCDGDLTSDLILDLQQRLQQQGYQPGDLDGLLGKRTLAALSHYQTSNGLAAGGITYESLAALGVTGIQ